MLVNKKAVKLYALDQWTKLRGSREMTRVSADLYDWADAKLKNLIDEMIRSHPSVGKTIKPE